jgi:putative glutamine amidotransferase
VVNTYHHQAVRAADLAPGLRATAWAESEAGELIEAFEAADGRFVLGVQCHPERTESTPPAFERLWGAFVEACRR